MNPQNWINVFDFCIVWMTAVIWLVQVLIYPNFQFIAEGDFKVFHKRHCDRIAIWVAPMMIQPFALAMIYFAGGFNGKFPSEWTAHAIATVLIYTSTALFSARQHTTLSKGKVTHTIDQLILWNWPRTLLWSAELVMVLARHFET